MNNIDLAAGRVVSVLLADGWHAIVPGSFSVGRLGFGSGTGPGVPGFQFEECDGSSPYRPKVLAGPLGSIVAVRQAAPAAHRVGHGGRAPVAHNGQRAGQDEWLLVRADALPATAG
jgi:hypothetical protein